MILYYHKNKPIRLLCNGNWLYEWKEYKHLKDIWLAEMVSIYTYV